MSILLIVRPKCTLAVSHAAPGESRRVCRRDRQTERHTDGRQTVTLLFPLDAAIAIRQVDCVKFRLGCLIYLCRCLYVATARYGEQRIDANKTLTSNVQCAVHVVLRSQPQTGNDRTTIIR